MTKVSAHFRICTTSTCTAQEPDYCKSRQLNSHHRLNPSLSDTRTHGHTRGASMASSNKRKHPNLASWLATFKSPATGEMHGHGGDQQMQEAAAAAVREALGAAADASSKAASGPEKTLRQATKDTSTWLEYHRTPAEVSGEAERDPRVPVFRLSHGARRHAAFICRSRQPGAKDSRICTCPATDSPGNCTDDACSHFGTAKVRAPAFYRCPGSCRGAVLAPSVCYPIAASICEREDEPIFAVVGCETCERQIRSSSGGSLALCGKPCTSCIPVYVNADLPTRNRSIVLTERCDIDTGVSSPSERSSETGSGKEQTEEPPTKRASR